MTQNIAFLAHDGCGQLGGVASWMANLIPWLRQRGVDARVYGFERGGESPLFGRFRRAGVPLCSTSHFQPLRWRVTWLEQQCRKDRISILVPNYFISGFTAARWLGANRPWVVGALHSDDAMYRRVITEVTGRSRDFPCDHLVAVSANLARQAEPAKVVGVPVSRIPYGVMLTKASRSRQLGDSFRVVYTGRIVQEQKRIIETVEAACAVVAALPGTSVDFIGDGPEAARCLQIVNARGAGQHVRFLGRLDGEDVLRRLANYDALLLLSDYEGLPISLLEAAAAGVVPICSRIESGVGEIVEHEVSGLFVSDRSAAVVSAIRRLKEDPRVWSLYSAEIRRRSQMFGADACGERWMDLFTTLGNTRKERAMASISGEKTLPQQYPEFAWDDARSFSALSFFRSRMGQLRRDFLAIGRRQYWSPSRDR